MLTTSISNVVCHDGLYLYSCVFAFSLKLISGEHIGALAMSEPNCQYHSLPLLFSPSGLKLRSLLMCC